VTLLRRVSVTVPDARAEQARAVMIELFPEGFEEIAGEGGLELVAYTNAAGEERIWQAFGGAAVSDIEDDWEDRWRQFHKPVRVGSLWIGPPWSKTTGRTAGDSSTSRSASDRCGSGHRGSNPTKGRSRS